MNKNVGKVDRTIRIIIGLIALGLGYYFQTWWGLLGLIPLLTASIGWCPLYCPLGLSTCARKNKS